LETKRNQYVKHEGGEEKEERVEQKGGKGREGGRGVEK
jgi:hypothetical protein